MTGRDGDLPFALVAGLAGLANEAPETEFRLSNLFTMLLTDPAPDRGALVATLGPRTPAECDVVVVTEERRDNDALEGEVSLDDTDLGEVGRLKPLGMGDTAEGELAEGEVAEGENVGGDTGGGDAGSGGGSAKLGMGNGGESERSGGGSLK